MPQSDALHARVRAFIAGESTEDFEALALSIAAFQRAHVEPVGRLARARLGDVPARSVDEIPALPTDVFRLRRVAAHPPSLDVRVFETSGTTQGAETKGRHPMRTLATYEAAAMAHAERLLFPDVKLGRALVLAPSSRDAPASSLSFMIDLFLERLGLARSATVSAGGAIDFEAVAREARDCARSGAPALVMGTAFAFVHAIDRLASDPVSLPAGSVAMITGGFKGRSREVPEGELREGIARWLGLDRARIVGEYGMTELSSQLYEPRIGAPAGFRASTYRAPAWLRVAAVDPITLAPLPRGAEGIARIVDLANVDSSIAIQTQDRVVVDEAGDVHLLGRLPGAVPRGCSLAMEDVLGS